MALNPSIILAGQAPDVMGAMSAGLQQAQNQLAFDRQNALADLYRTQGAGIIAGDQGALNQLAQFDPMAALGVQDARLGMDSTRLSMDATRQRMTALDASEEREAERYAREIGAEAAAAEAAKIEEAVKAAMMAPDAATFDAMMAQMAPELVGQFDNRQMLASRFMSVAEVMKMTAPPDPMDALKLEEQRLKVEGMRNPTPADEYQRYVAEETAAGRQPLSRIDYAQAVKGNGVTQTITNPDGSTTTIQVGGRAGAGGGKPLTEGQSKDNVYATRANGALQALETPIDPNNPQGPTLADALSDRRGVVGDALGGVTLGYSREVMQTPEYQTARTAGDEFLQAILRKDTGAAITAQEQELYGKTYLPQPGDSPQQLAYKAEARRRAVAAMQAGMSADQLQMVTRALAMGDLAAADSIIGQVGATTQPAAPPMGDLSDDDLLRMYGGE